jgi:hypothetical protein
MNKLFGTILALFVVIGIFKFMPQSNAKYEQPPYTVEKKDGAYEVRHYPPMVLAEVMLEGMPEGDREETANQGFRLLFGYISGQNATGEKLAMTIPVFQELIIPGNCHFAGRWAFRFVMPSHKRLADLPKPNSDRIHLVEAPAMKVAVKTFNGGFNTKNLTAHKNELDAWVIKKGLIFEPDRHEIFAAYNGPFTWPSKRRNEVMFRLK